MESAATPSEPRLRALVEAGIALASELSLDGLLQRLTELAAELTGARYAALPAGPEQVRIVAAAGEQADEVLSELLPLHESKTGRVFERRRSERVDSVLDDPEVDRVFTRRVDARGPLGAAARPGPADRRDLGL